MFKRQIISGILLVVGVVLMSCTPVTEVPEEPAVLPTDPSPPQEPAGVPTEEPILEPAAEQEVRIYFEQLGISMELPQGLGVIKDPIIDLDDPSQLQSYLFYIQRYNPAEGSGADYFQIYGHLQYDLPQANWEEYKSEVLNSDMYQYAREIEVNGLSGLDTQLAGQRNRFVYLFSLDGQILSLSVSDPTEENKDLADQIINTLEYKSGSVTGRSGMQLISDAKGYYQMYLPDDWEYTINPTAGIRMAELQASSAGAEMVIEESAGPHDKIYYKDGVFLNVVVLEDDSASAEPVMALTRRSDPIMISGIAGLDYIFLEPSTAEGEIREIRYYHNGLSYLVRFSYALDADQEQIDWLIRNFQITP